MTRKFKKNILPFPLERVSKAKMPFAHAAEIVILPSIRIERHSDHPDFSPKMKRKRA